MEKRASTKTGVRLTETAGVSAFDGKLACADRLMPRMRPPCPRPPNGSEVNPRGQGPRAEADAAKEHAFWSAIKSSGSATGDAYVKAAQTAFQRLIAAATSDPTEAKVTQAWQAVVDKVRFLSSGSRGKMFKTLVTLGHEKAIPFALASMLKPEELRNLLARNDNFTYDAIVGIAHVAVLEGGGDAARLFDFLYVVQTTTAAMGAELARAKEFAEATKAEHLAAVGAVRESVSEAESTVKALTARLDSQLTEIRDKFEGETNDIRKKFEEQFALRTPMTYWHEKAERHVGAARVYRRWFSGLMIGGLAAFVTVGYIWLFPFLQKHPTGYWALILFSVTIAVWAWPLRISSKLYLTHTQLFEDAAEREVIARTFLALAEQMTLSDADRQLLLGALLRPASISLASDDTGINLADVVTAKTLMKT